jgi:hypothetical protein
MTDDAKDQRNSARKEWVRLCGTLESAQGDELSKQCRDPYQFARTYQQYGARFDEIAHGVQQAVRRGDTTFFRERGVPSDMINDSFTKLLLADWLDCIKTKKQKVAEVFQLKFQQAVEHFIQAEVNTSKLNTARPLHESDALLQLSGRSQPIVNLQDISDLRTEMQQLRQQLEELTLYVKTELTSLKQQP